MFSMASSLSGFSIGPIFGGIKPILGSVSLVVSPVASEDASNMEDNNLYMYSRSFVSDIFSFPIFCCDLSVFWATIIIWHCQLCPRYHALQRKVKPFWIIFVEYWMKYFHISCVTKFTKILYGDQNLLFSTRVYKAKNEGELVLSRFRSLPSCPCSHLWNNLLSS